MKTELVLSEKFNLDDIRKLREYNAARYKNMTTKEIVEETKAGAAEVLVGLEPRKHVQV